MGEAGTKDWPAELDTEWREVRGVRISRHACVAEWVTLGDGVVVHPFALVGHLPSQAKVLCHSPNRALEMRVWDNVEIGPHTTLYGGCEIGPDSLIGDGASIREYVRIGSRCIIGRHVCINFNAQIGDDVRIMDGSFVAEGCRIGSNSFLGAGVVMSGDRRPGREYKPGGAPVIGKNCLIGSGANLLPGVTIGDGAVIGAGALVGKDVPAGATVLGPLATPRDAAGRVLWLEPHEAAQISRPEHHAV